MMHRQSWSRALVALLFVGVAGPAWAEGPTYVNMEGLIFEDDDLPLEGVLDLEFAIYDVEEGGDPLWFESHQLRVTQGYYRVLMGKETSLAGLFDSGDRYLGISIDGGDELSPRQPLAAVPFAMVADNVTGDITPSSIEVAGQRIIDAQGNWVGPARSLRASLLSVDGAGSELDADVIDGLDSSKFMRVDQTTGTSGNLTVAGRAGVGTADPGSQLHVVGGSRFQGGRNHFTDSENAGRVRLGAAWGIPGIYSEDGQDLVLGVDPAHKVHLGTSGNFATVDGATGNLGLGTATPAYKLDVNGVARVSGGVRVEGFGLTGASANNVTGTMLNLSGKISNGPEHNFDGSLSGKGTNFTGTGLITTGQGEPKSAIVYGDWNDLWFVHTDWPSLARKNYEVPMVIKANGNVGIGTIDPQSALDVKGAGRFTSLKLEPLSEPPGGATVGSIYLDEQTGTIQMYDGEDWAAIGGGPKLSSGTIGGAYYGGTADSGADATSALPYAVQYTKKQDNTHLQVTLSSNLRNYPSNGSCVRWAIRVDGGQCSPRPVNGNVYISPGGNYHHHRTITGICTGVGAGAHTIQPYVENCPGYGTVDAHTGWNSSTFMIVEEKNPDSMAFQAVEEAHGGDAGTTLPYEVIYVKKEASSNLKLEFSSNLRTHGGAGACCRWNVRVNGADCSPAVNGTVYINPGGNYHQHHTITGMCRGIAAGNARVQTTIDNCPGYGSHDCYTGWNSTTSLIVEEMPADGNVVYAAIPAPFWGEDATTALPISLVHNKKQDDSLLKLTFNSSMRTYWNAGSCCRWAIRVDGAQCPSTAINGNVYLSPASDPHHVRTIVGMCGGLSAGNHTIQPYVEQCPGYGNHDCYTGWNTTTSLISEEMKF